MTPQRSPSYGEDIVSQICREKGHVRHMSGTNRLTSSKMVSKVVDRSKRLRSTNNKTRRLWCLETPSVPFGRKERVHDFSIDPERDPEPEGVFRRQSFEPAGCGCVPFGSMKTDEEPASLAKKQCKSKYSKRSPAFCHTPLLTMQTRQTRQTQGASR